MSEQTLPQNAVTMRLWDFDPNLYRRAEMSLKHPTLRDRDRDNNHRFIVAPTPNRTEALKTVWDYHWSRNGEGVEDKDFRSWSHIRTRIAQASYCISEINEFFLPMLNFCKAHDLQMWRCYPFLYGSDLIALVGQVPWGGIYHRLASRVSLKDSLDTLFTEANLRGLDRDNESMYNGMKVHDAKVIQLTRPEDVSTCPESLFETSEQYLWETKAFWVATPANLFHEHSPTVVHSLPEPSLQPLEI